MSSSTNARAELPQVEYLGGIHLADSVLWFDAPRRADLSFLSHAHVPASGRHGKLLMSEPTARLMERPLHGPGALVSPYFRRFSLGELDLELFPAGHVYGSAQLRVTRGEARVVYTGHLNLAASRIAEQATVLLCEVLVLAVHYALPHMVFPPRAAVEQDILAWIDAVLSRGDRPVLMTSPLGTAQELAALLGQAGIAVRAHRAIYEQCKRIHGLGVKLPNVRCYRGTPRQGEVGLFPIPRSASQTGRVVRTLTAEKASGASLALVSGEPATHNRIGRLKLERHFPLSSLADHQALTRYALESKARHIAVVGRHAAVFAAGLRERGLSAWPLRPPQQLDLLSPQASN